MSGSVRNSAVKDSVLTTISIRGKPWTTLLGEGILGIPSWPFGFFQRASNCFVFAEMSDETALSEEIYEAVKDAVEESSAF